LPLDVAASVQKLVRRCLTKERKQRLQAIGEAQIVFENPGGTEGRAPAGSQPRPKIPWGIAIPVTPLPSVRLPLVIVSKIVQSADVMRFSFVLPKDQAFTNQGRHLIAISPDGANIVYVALILAREREVFQYVFHVELTGVRRYETTDAVPWGRAV